MKFQGIFVIFFILLSVSCENDRKKNMQFDDDEGDDMEILKNYDELPLVSKEFDSLYLELNNSRTTYYPGDTILHPDSVEHLFLQEVKYPVSLKPFVNLKYLVYDAFDSLSPESFPIDFCELDSLKFIEYYCYNRIKIINDFNRLKCLKNLESLNFVSFCDLPIEILEFKYLKQLMITGMIETFPYFISEMKNLKFVAIRGSKIPVKEQKEILEKFKGKVKIIFIEDDFKSCD